MKHLIRIIIIGTCISLPAGWALYHEPLGGQELLLSDVFDLLLLPQEMTARIASSVFNPFIFDSIIAGHIFAFIVTLPLSIVAASIIYGAWQLCSVPFRKTKKASNQSTHSITGSAGSE